MIFTFDQLVAYGRGYREGQNSPLQKHETIPWHFKVLGIPISHENDTLYVVSVPKGQNVHFRSGQILDIHEDGATVHG